jgi:cyclopropane fatty-acyl-phospholipid synthase-like methyltransferase
MDRTRFSFLAHADHDVCNPIGDAKVDGMLARLGVGPGDAVLDIGAGKGEMLLRLVERRGVWGVAVEPAALFADEARRRAAARVPAGSFTVVQEQAAPFLERSPALGAKAAMCVGSTHALGDLAGTLSALRGHLEPGARVLVGEGYWKRPPDPEYLAALGGAEESEMRSHAATVEAVEAQGYRALWAVTASEDEWDEYEWRYAHAIERFAAAHPDDPDRAAMLERSRAWRATYLRWGRQTMGFGLYLLEWPG